MFFLDFGSHAIHCVEKNTQQFLKHFPLCAMHCVGEWCKKSYFGGNFCI